MIVLKRDDEEELKGSCDDETNGREIRIESGRNLDQNMVDKEEDGEEATERFHASKGGTTEAHLQRAAAGDACRSIGLRVHRSGLPDFRTNGPKSRFSEPRVLEENT